MRNALKFALVGCVFLVLLGLGWYFQNLNEVHNWIRTAGRKPRAPNEVVVKQRSTAVVPGLDGTIKVRVGDIKRGRTADVEILGADSLILAAKSGAQIGDRLSFTHDGKNYQIEVIRYVNDLGTEDHARFRLIP